MALARAREGTVECQELFARQAAEQLRLERARIVARVTAASAGVVNVSPEHGGVLEEAALGRVESVEASGDERLERGSGRRTAHRGSVEAERARRPRTRRPSSSEHPDRLDREQRHALRALHDLAHDGLGQVRARGRRSRSAHGRVAPSGSRCDGWRRGCARCPSPASLEELGAGQRRPPGSDASRDHSSRWSMKSSRPASAQWRSSKTSTTVPCAEMRSKKVRHAANSSSRSPARRVGEAEQGRQRRLDPARARRGR